MLDSDDRYATVLTAPPDPAAVAAASLPQTGTPTQDVRGSAVARAEEQRLQGEMVALMARLRRQEAGNYVDAMIRREPDLRYVFFFKRDPGKTLAKYTREARFVAEQAVYGRDDRERLMAPWAARWKSEGIPHAYGLNAVYPTMDVRLGIGAADYRALAAEKGWGDPPALIVLKFSKDPVRPAVDPRVASFLRGFAYEKRPTLMQLSALGTGRLVLKDGCLRLDKQGGTGPTVVFHFETGIGLDRQGYLALIDRMTGEVRARVGEDLAWGAPNEVPEKGMVGLGELRAACPGTVVNIGNPESKAAFEARYPNAR